MPYAYVQQVENSLASATSSIAAPSISCTAHNTVLVLGSQNPGSTPSITDTAGNSYSLLGHSSLFAFGVFLYICQDTLGGANVITTHTNGTDCNGILVSEWSGLVTSGGALGVAFNGQNGPGSGADAVTSGTMVISSGTPAASISFGWDNTAGTFIPVHGTGFSSHTAVWAAINGNAQALLEDQRITSSGTYAGTWSADPSNTGDLFSTIAVILAELGGTALMGQICT